MPLDQILLFVLKIYITYILPALVLISYLISGRSNDLFTISFTLFICLFSFVASRTLFSKTKERKPERLSGDWTLPLAMSVHLGMATFMVVEFNFLISGQYLLMQRPIYLVIGLILLGSSVSLRRWAVKSLGSQWSIHAVGAQQIKKVRVTTIGPYKYVRHPIYISWILDAISLPFMWALPVSFLIAATLVTPAYILRAMYEERASIRRFGRPYLRYMIATDAFIPSNLLSSGKRAPKLYKRKAN